MDQENWKDSHQFEFWHFESTTDYLARLEADICDTFANKFHLLSVALDFEKAFEMVCKEDIIDTLEESGLTGNILTFVKNFLLHREIKVRYKNRLSDLRGTINGVPTGSVIGVVLFLSQINKILKLIYPPLRVYLFADDLTIVCPGKNLKITIQLMQSVLDSINTWTQMTGFKFSAAKSRCIIFSHKIIRDKTDLHINK